MKSIYKQVALVGVSLSALVMPNQAFAQDEAPQAEEASNDEVVIIVQARRKDESAQDVPSVVNAVTAEDLGKLNLRKFEDIASVVPGLSLSSNANGVGGTATVRGVNYDVNVSGNNGTVQFYQNDVPVSAGLLFNSLFDVGQIEVLRGPQGTLKGRSSPSGAITLYTRRPDLTEAGGNIDATINDLHGYQLKGAFNIPIVADRLGIRLAGVTSDGRGNLVRDIVNTDKPNDESKGLRASIKAIPVEDVLELDFAYQGLNRKSTQFVQNESASEIIPGFVSPPGHVVIEAEDRLSAVGTPQVNNQTFKTYDWQAKLTLAGQQLTYVGGHSTQRLISSQPTDIGAVFAVDASPAGTLFAQPTDTLAKNTSHEIRLQNQERVAGIFDYVVGALFAKGSSDTDFGSVTGIAIAPPFASPPRLVNIALTPIERPGKNKETSFFANLTAHLGEATEISGGIRRIKYEDESGLIVSGVPQPALARAFTEKKTIYQASIKHEFSDDLMIYASTGSSFRPSTVAIGGPNGGLSALQVAFLATAPETSKSYEVGFKSEWLNDTVTFNVTAFQQKFKDYPYRSASGVFAIDRTNPVNPSVVAFNYIAGVPVKVTGVEGELSFRPSNNFNIGGILSYSKGTISNGTIPCLDLNDDGVPDTVASAPSLPDLEADVGADNIGTCQAAFNATIAPRWSGSVQSEYSMPLSGSADGYLRGLYTWKGNSDNDPTNSFDDIKSYGILNLYAGVRDPDGGWELSFFAKNITDTFRVLTRSNGVASTPLRGGIPLGGPVVSSGALSNGYFAGSNVYGMQTTEPREFGVNLKVAFGSR